MGMDGMGWSVFNESAGALVVVVISGPRGGLAFDFLEVERVCGGVRSDSYR